MRLVQKKKKNNVDNFVSFSVIKQSAEIVQDRPPGGRVVGIKTLQCVKFE